MKKTIIAPEASGKNQRVNLGERYPDKDETNPTHEKLLRKAELRGKYVTLADQIAEDVTSFGNYKYPKCWEVFPHNPEMHFVDRYYPNAKKGPLLVDEPQTEKQMLRAYDKQKVLRKQGYRHIVIEKDSTLEDLLTQLGEL